MGIQICSSKRFCGDQIMNMKMLLNYKALYRCKILMMMITVFEMKCSPGIETEPGPCDCGGTVHFFWMLSLLRRPWLLSLLRIS